MLVICSPWPTGSMYNGLQISIIPGVTGEATVESCHGENAHLKINKQAWSELDVAAEPSNASDCENTPVRSHSVERHPEGKPQPVIPQAIVKDAQPVSGSQSNALELNGEGTEEDQSSYSFPHSDPVSESSSMSAHPTVASQTCQEEVWSLDSSGPPASASFPYGPLRPVDLYKKLGRRLDEDAV
jgi:hypothetical protein